MSGCSAVPNRETAEEASAQRGKEDQQNFGTAGP